VIRSTLESSVADDPELTRTGSVAIAMLPVMAVVLVGFLIIGMAMPVLPLHVHQRLGLGTFMVGVIAGAQFAAALLSRFWSGRYADTRGAKRAMTVGLLLAAAAGAIYMVSLGFTESPKLSVTILLVGRAILGWSESCIITGALSWGLARGGARNAGMVISWVGTALWAAYAAGAPVGTVLYDHFGFAGVAIATALLPLITMGFVGVLRPIAPSGEKSPSFRRVISAVRAPGLGLALGSVGFGAITTFITLLFAERHWQSAWIVFTSLSIAFILGRVVFGHLPDRIGGARVALVCIGVEAVGLALIWLATSPMLVFVAAAITGAGYSLVYPAFGVDAVRRAPPESRGLAMGAFTAFLDLALGIANPALGLVAARAGLRSVFLVSTVVVLGAAPVALRLGRAPATV
jgi:MFS family permease